MAALAARSPYPAPPLQSTMAPPHYRPLAPPPPPPPPHAAPAHGLFTSPTESEFSESCREAREAKESILDWDEARVGDWLVSINCAQYVDIFRHHNITGENLLDLDQATLKEMGIKKIGDRVRINTHAKVFRSHVYRRTSKRVVNRHSLATLDAPQQLTPPPSASPRPLHAARSGAASRADKRMSRPLHGADGVCAAQVGKSSSSSSSRPGSPMVDPEPRTRRHPAPGPMEGARKDGGSHSYAPAPNPPLTARFAGSSRPPLDAAPPPARFHHVRAQPSLENLIPNAGSLPAGKPLIRVIFESGNASVINIEGFRTAEDIIRKTLRKGALNENHFRSYCFYVLDGTDPNPNFCRRLGEAELCKLCQDAVRTERGRLILRKIHAGEPDGEQLKTAAQIAEQQQPEPPAIEVLPMPYKTKSQLKIEKLTGEPSLAAVSYPMSPATQAERNDYFATPSPAGPVGSRHVSAASTASARARKLKDFYGARPPTELITQDLQSYFPEVGKEEMDRTVRMSIRRSRRLSRAVRTLSMASTFSVASSLKDAPPLPTIADAWLKEAPKPGLRPLSVVRLGRPDSHRESVSSGVLEPLDEESPPEPNRKSYVSFGGDSGSDTTTTTTAAAAAAAATHHLPVTEPHPATSYLDDTGSSPAGTEAGSESLNSRLSKFIAEDGEESDDELIAHLESGSWDDLKYLKGAMIGQGSFGTVFLALHAVTAELMAVKQVEMPTNSGTAMDAKKNNMIEALKHEITLLRDLKHDNIVRYLGSNSDDKNLNIFLEYVAGGSVATMLVNYGSLPEGLVSNFVRQILQGLNYLHSQDIIHRDIKGANILVDNKGTVKISDFGISKRVEASTLLHPSPHKRGGPRVSLQGSVFWMAPEVVRQTAYTKKADIWSLGCLVVEMMTGSHPHPNCTQLQAIFKIGGSGANADNAKPDLPESATEHAKEFLRRTFELEHEKRPSAEELMEMEFTKVKG